MFLSRNKKNSVYPCKPQFYYIKVGLRASKLYRCVFVMCGLGGLVVSTLDLQDEGCRLESYLGPENFQTIITPTS